MDNDVTLGALCLALVGILSWVIKYLAKINGNHLRHIQESIDTLPCKKAAECPEDRADGPARLN